MRYSWECLLTGTGTVHRKTAAYGNFFTPIIRGYFESAAASIIFNARCDCNSAIDRIPQR
jgi:hypothetical protein